MIEVILRGGHLRHAHDPHDVRGADLTKCGLRLRPGWLAAPAEGPDETRKECKRCDRRIEFEEYVAALGGYLRPDGSGTMDAP